MLFTRLSIKKKLILIVTLPFLIALYFISNHALSLQRQVTELSQHKKLAQLNQVASHLIHELQMEASYAAGLLSGDGYTFSEDLTEQINETSHAIALLQSRLDALNITQKNTLSAIKHLEQTLSQLSSFRAETFELTMEPEKAIIFYQQVNTDLLIFNQLLFQMSAIPELVNSASFLYYLQMNKERAALERDILVATFLPDHFTNPLRQAFIAYLSDQKTLLELANNYVNTPSQTEMLTMSLVAADDDELKRLRQKALSRKHSFNESATHWLEIANTYHTKLQAQETLAHTLLLQQLDQHFIQTQTQFWQTLAASLFAILLSIFMIRAIIHSISSRLAKLASTMKQVEQDNDLSIRIPVHETDEISTIANAFNFMQDKLAQLVHQVLSSTKEINHTFENAKLATSQVSNKIEIGQHLAHQATQSMTEISQSIQMIADNCAQASLMSEKASGEAKKGEQAIKSADLAMQALDGQLQTANGTVQALATGSEQVNVILDVIKGVAEKTNLLALNAAIEAARAGEHGRGFAVVADEVRHLASQTQNNTEQIQQDIDQLQQKSLSSLKSMQQSQQQALQTIEIFTQTLSLLTDIQLSTYQVNHLNGQNATATEQQSKGIKNLHTSVNQIQSHYQESNQEMKCLLEINRHQADLMYKLEQHVYAFKLVNTID